MKEYSKETQEFLEECRNLPITEIALLKIKEEHSNFLKNPYITDINDLKRLDRMKVLMRVKEDLEIKIVKL